MLKFLLTLGIVTAVASFAIIAWIAYDLWHDRIDRAIRDAFNEWLR